MTDSRPLALAVGRRSTPGPAVVFDMDGVLSDAAGRQHHLERPWRDWDAFFDAVGEDALITEVARLLDVIDPDLHIVLLTARPMQRPAADAGVARRSTSSGGTCSSCATGATTAPRATSSATPSTICGPTASTCASRSRTTGATSTMFHREGVPCVYIHSGYYD